MNITFFDTAIGSSNLGDIIIQRSIESALGGLLKNAFVIRFATHLKNYGLIQSINNFKINFSNKCDYKFIAGTNLLSSHLLKTCGQWQIGPISAELYKNSILVGVGTTSDNEQPSIYSKLIYKRILRKDIFHSVRDEQSEKILKNMGFHVLNTGCPTLWKFTPEFCKSIPEKKQDNVIISLSGNKYFRDNEKDQSMLNQIEKLYDKKYFWAQTSEDESYFDSLNHSPDYSRVYSLESFSEICRSGGVEYVGTRLHGGVFAIQNGIRSLIIGIDHRARGFKESNNLNVFDRNNMEELTDVLNGSMPTCININQTAIDEFLGQFIK